MPKVGDRVVVAGQKVGGGTREGTLTGVVGSMIRVRWTDGAETLFSPGAGTVEYLAGKAKPNGKTAAKAAAKPAKKPASKKDAPKAKKKSKKK